MNNKLTLSIEKDVIEAAKEYAKKKGKTLSEIVESYFKSVTENLGTTKEKQLPRKTQSLREIVRVTEKFDPNEILTEELLKKHGL